MAWNTVCNRCNRLVEVDDDTGLEAGHDWPCAGEPPAEVGEPQGMTPEV